MTDNACLEMIRRHAQQLGEHFESVQIFVTRQAPDTLGETNTESFNAGTGNWFARYGQVKDWITKEEERTRQELIDDQSS